MVLVREWGVWECKVLWGRGGELGNIITFNITLDRDKSYFLFYIDYFRAMKGRGGK